MGRKKFCYWSVADGQHALMMQTCVRSARAAGVTEDFHVWSDRAIAGATSPDAGQFDKHLYHFKFDFLQKQAARLNYDYFVWLDADNYFVRHPGDVLSVVGGDAIHACLESNICALDNLRPDWWGCPLPALVKFMRVNGVRHECGSLGHVGPINWDGLVIDDARVIQFALRVRLGAGDIILGIGFVFKSEPGRVVGSQLLARRLPFAFGRGGLEFLQAGKPALDLLVEQLGHLDELGMLGA